MEALWAHMGPHFMLLLSIYGLYSYVTYIHPSCIMSWRKKNCFKIGFNMIQLNGIRNVMQSWFKSYLSNRKQYVSQKLQILYVKHNIRCSARLKVWPSTFSLVYQCHAYVDPQTRFVSFIFVTIQQFLRPPVTLTMFMPLPTGNW